MDLLNAKNRDLLVATIERIEDAEAEVVEARERVKAAFSAAAGAGFDAKAIRQLIKERKADSEKSIKKRRLVELYRRSIAGLSGTPLGDWARSWIAEDARAKRGDAHEEEPLLSDFMRKKSAKGNPTDPSDDHPQA